MLKMFTELNVDLSKCNSGLGLNKFGEQVFNLKFQKDSANSNTRKNFSVRPIIIFYHNGYYYYLKATSTFYKNGLKRKSVQKTNSEFYVDIESAEAQKAGFSKDTTIDTSIIYKIEKNLLESIVLQSTEKTVSSDLDSKVVCKILKKLLDNGAKQPPNVVFLNVLKKEDLTHPGKIFLNGKVLYGNINLLENEKKIYPNRDYDKIIDAIASKANKDIKNIQNLEDVYYGIETYLNNILDNSSEIKEDKETNTDKKKPNSSHDFRKR